MGVTLVQSVLVGPIFSTGSTIASSGFSVVNAGDMLLVAVVSYGTSISVAGVSGGPTTWTHLGSEQGPGGVGDVEWWYGANAPSGAQTITVNFGISEPGSFTIFELSGANTPVFGGSAFGTSTTVTYPSMTVNNAGSWLAVASIVSTNSAEFTSTGLGTFLTGPLYFGNPIAGITYGVAYTSSPAPAGTGWTMSSSQAWATAGVVVPPAPVTLVQTGVTIFNTTASPSARTVSLSGVSSGDILVIAASVVGSTGVTISSISTTAGTTTSWTRVFSTIVGGEDLEWWYATAQSSGSITASVTPSGNSTFGIWIGELSNGVLGQAPGIPVMAECSSITAGGTTVNYNAMTVIIPNSWVAIASVTSSVAETNSTGLGTFDAGPTKSGSQYAGLTYGNTTSAQTSAATGWTTASGANATIGIVVPFIAGATIAWF